MSKGQENDLLPHHGNSGVSHSDGDTSFSGSVTGFDWLLAESWFDESPGSRVDLDLVAPQDDGAEPLDSGPQFDFATFGDLSDDRTADQPRQRRLNRITEDDFDSEEEREAYRLIKRQTELLFSEKKKDIKDRTQAVQWIFGNSADEYGATMDLCCEVLNARKSIAQVRIHYEFWKRWIVFPHDLPFEVSPIPTALRHEIRYISRETLIAKGFVADPDEGLYLAQEAWVRPGISTHELLAKASENGKVAPFMPAILSALEARHILSSRTNCWYLTGRNPMLAYEEAVAKGLSPRMETPCWSRYWPKSVD